MRTLVLTIVFFSCGDLFGQSVLDALRQPVASPDVELLNQANQAAQSTSNALAKRANLLQRRADTLRSQVDQLEKEVEVLRAERAALKAAVIDCRDQFIAILDLIEKKDFTAIAGPIENLRATYTKSLLNKLTTNDRAAEDVKSGDSVEQNPPSAQPAVVTPKATLPASSVPASSKEQTPTKAGADD